MKVMNLSEDARVKVASVMAKQEPRKDGLRIQVVGGGCSGLSYRITLDSENEQDFVEEYPGGVKLLIDPKSAPLLTDATLEYFDDLERSGFEINNPQATGGCGCGKSFSA